MEAAGRQYGVCLSHRLFHGCRCLAVPGTLGWARRELKDGGCGGKPSGESLGLWEGFPPAALTGRALLLFLTSPPRVSR
jgi:hypothetical protein